MVSATKIRTWAALTVVMAVGILAAAIVLRQPHHADAANPAAQDKKSEDKAPAQEQALRKSFAGYIEAMNKGELDAVMAYWAPDADYTDEDGTVTKGKQALTEQFKKSLGRLKGIKVTGKVNSLRFLRPEVAMEDGTLEFKSTDGTREFNRYVVVWTLNKDKWLISSARDLPSEVQDVPSAAYPQLRMLEWLVGEWQDASDKTDVRMTCKWGPNKSFLLVDYTVKQEGEEPMLVNMRIGWDERNNLVRSWVFDSTGGFGEGYWSREGNKWTVGTSGILPDGGAGAATHFYQFMDDDTFMYRAVDREVDGQPLADVEVKMVRVKAGK